MREADRDHCLSQSQVICILLYVLGILWVDAWLAWWKEVFQIDRLIGGPFSRVVAIVKQ